MKHMKGGRQCCGPDFIGIGFQRCASSWLNRVLYEHPGVSKPQRGVHFFNRYYERGLEWYLGELACQVKGDVTVIGEFSTTYSYPENAAGVARRIQEHFPMTKIIACIREPVSRFCSDYHRGISRGEVRNVGIMSVLAEHPSYLERGFYSRVLSEFIGRFPRENVHVIRYDDIGQRPTETLRKLFSFLGVDPSFMPSVLRERVGASCKARNAVLERRLTAVQAHCGRFARSLGLRKLAQTLKLGRAFTVIRRWNTVAEGEDRETREALIYLRKLYTGDIGRTMEITGLDLSNWLRSK